MAKQKNEPLNILANPKEDSKLVVVMALIAAVLMVAIGCVGYFVTPKLEIQPVQQQREPVQHLSTPTN